MNREKEHTKVNISSRLTTDDSRLTIHGNDITEKPTIKIQKNQNEIQNEIVVQ